MNSFSPNCSDSEVKALLEDILGQCLEVRFWVLVEKVTVSQRANCGISAAISWFIAHPAMIFSYIYH